MARPEMNKQKFNYVDEQDEEFKMIIRWTEKPKTDVQLAKEREKAEQIAIDKVDQAIYEAQRLFEEKDGETKAEK